MYNEQTLSQKYIIYQPNIRDYLKNMLNTITNQQLTITKNSPWTRLLKLTIYFILYLFDIVWLLLIIINQLHITYIWYRCYDRSLPLTYRMMLIFYCDYYMTFSKCFKLYSWFFQLKMTKYEQFLTCHIPIFLAIALHITS